MRINTWQAVQVIAPNTAPLTLVDAILQALHRNLCVEMSVCQKLEQLSEECQHLNSVTENCGLRSNGSSIAGAPRYGGAYSWYGTPKNA